MEMFYDLKKNPNFRRPLNAALSDSLLAQFTKPIENDGLNQQTETRTLLKKLRALFPPLYKSNLDSPSWSFTVSRSNSFS